MRELLITNQNSDLPFNAYSRLKLTDLSLQTIINSSDIQVSVEICPNRYLDTQILSELPVSFCSVTWFNPTNEELKNVETIPAIQLAKQLRFHGYNVLLHIAGRNLKRYQVLNILEVLKDAGIRNILALQGDSSQIKEKDDKKCDFPYASDLVKFIKSCYGSFFTIGVAGYPQKHPNSASTESDLEYLKYKILCGADFILSQACYNYSTFANFVKQCRSIGLRIPIIPGIFVISSHRSLIAMSNFCGVPIPKSILASVESNKNNDIAVRDFGIIQASELMKNILENRQLFGGIHVFSLNNMELFGEVLLRVGLCLRVERPLRLSKNVFHN